MSKEKVECVFNTDPRYEFDPSEPFLPIVDSKTGTVRYIEPRKLKEKENEVAD